MRRNQVFGFALALAVVTGAQSASAQQQQQPAQGHEQHAREGRRQGGGPFQRLFHGVQLTEAQQQQVRQIFQEGRPARPQGERGAQGGERRARGERPQLTAEARAELQKRRQEMQARRTQQIARIRGILTPEQRTVFDRNVAQMEAGRREQGERRGRNGGERGNAAGRQS